MTVKYDVHIEAPVEKVFTFFKDPRNWATAAPETRVQTTRVHVTQEGLGTFYVWSAKMPGFRLEGFGVFVEFVPNKRIVDKQSWAFEGTWTYTFEPEGSGTRLTMERRPRSFWRLPLFDWLWYLIEGPIWEQSKGFVPQPKRWVVEQVNGTLMLHRRLARDYDHRPDNAASRVYWASTAVMLRRLTTPSSAWRDDSELVA